MLAIIIVYIIISMFRVFGIQYESNQPTFYLLCACFSDDSWMGGPWPPGGEDNGIECCGGQVSTFMELLFVPLVGDGQWGG